MVEALVANPSRAADLAEAGGHIERTGEAAFCDQVAEAISQGLVIGWLEGRMKWAPRRADMKDIPNRTIKRRESFRAFAPSVLREAVPEWFEINGEVPFLMQMYPIHAEKRDLIPAVTHVDGTAASRR